jgi:hypothetical protein
MLSMRIALALLITGCGASAPAPSHAQPLAQTPPPAQAPAPRRPAPRPPIELRARVFHSAAELGPLAAQLPPDMDWSGHALVLAGGWLPPNAREVVVVDLTAAAESAAGGVRNMDSVGPTEAVHAQVVDGALRISFVHDVNETGYCCAGMVDMRAIDARCRDGLPPPMPERADPDRPLIVFFLLVSSGVAEHVVVERTTTLCARP